MLVDQERVLVAQVKPSDRGFVCSLCFSRFTNYYPGQFYDHVLECAGPKLSEKDRLVCASGRTSIYKIGKMSTLWTDLKNMAEVSRIQKPDPRDFENSILINDNYGNTFAAILDDCQLIGYISLHPLPSTMGGVIDWFIHPAMDRNEVLRQFTEAFLREGYDGKQIQSDAAISTQRFSDFETDHNNLGRVLSPADTADVVLLHPYFELAMWHDCTQRNQRRRLISRRKYLDESARDKEFALERQSFHKNWWKLFEERRNPPCLDKIDLSKRAIAELLMHQDMMCETIQQLRSPEVSVSEVQRVLVYAQEIEAHPLVVADLEKIVTGKKGASPETAVRIKPMDHVFISYGHDLHGTVAESVRQWLDEAGMPVWIDKENLDSPAGEQLDPAIASAINSSSVVCVCVSLGMAERDRYLQREIRHLVTLGQSMEGRPGLVLLCCDESPPPKALQDLSAEVVSFPPTQSKVVAAVRRAKMDKSQWRQGTLGLKEAGHTPAAVNEREDARKIRNEEMGKRAHVVDLGIDACIRRKDEVEFLRYLIEHWEESAKLISGKCYDEVVTLWSPICRDTLFSLRLPRWIDRPMVRFFMLNVKGDLVAANLNVGDGSSRGFKAAFRELFDIVGCPSFSMGGSGWESLPDTEARLANIVLLDCLGIARQLCKSGDKRHVACLAECSEEEVYEFCHQVDRRIAEIQSVQLGLEEFV